MWKGLQQLVWITSVSGQTVQIRHHDRSQISVQTHECTYQSTLVMGKRLLWYLQNSRALKLTYTSYLWFSRENWCRLVSWRELQKISDGLFLQAQRTWRSSQLGCQEAGHSCSSFIRKRLSGHDSSSSKTLYLKAILKYSTITSNSNWRGQTQLYQIVFHTRVLFHLRFVFLIRVVFHFILDKTGDGTVQFIKFLLTKWQLTFSRNSQH